MSAARPVIAACLLALVAALGSAGCGSDVKAGAFARPTATRAVPTAAPSPTATPLAGGA